MVFWAVGESSIGTNIFGIISTSTCDFSIVVGASSKPAPVFETVLGSELLFTNPRKARGLSLVPVLCGYKYLHEILSQKTGKEFLRY